MESKHILKKNYSFKRISRKIWMHMARKLPLLPGNLRARMFSVAGVNFEDVTTNFIGYNVYFDDLHPELITVGANTIITEGTSILTHFLDVSYDDFNHMYLGEIIIEHDVFIGLNTVFVKPVRVGKGAIIGANSVVNKDIKAYTVNGGNPIKSIIKREIKNGN